MQLAAMMRIQASLNAQAQQQQRILAHTQHQQIAAQIHTTTLTWPSRGPTSPLHASAYQALGVITPSPNAQTRPAYNPFRSGPIGSDGSSFVSSCDLGDSDSRPSVPRSGPAPPSASEIDKVRGHGGAVVYYYSIRVYLQSVTM
ncbi:hypothetical protein ACJQWK_01121 [Exserohilum turcicum]